MYFRIHFIDHIFYFINRQWKNQLRYWVAYISFCSAGKCNSCPSRWQHPNIGLELRVLDLFFNGRVCVILEVIIIYSSGFFVAEMPAMKEI